MTIVQNGQMNTLAYLFFFQTQFSEIRLFLYGNLYVKQLYILLTNFNSYVKETYIDKPDEPISQKFKILSMTQVLPMIMILRFP